jgi:glycosyltransferase involved in cell wall biosynthesis
MFKKKREHFASNLNPTIITPSRWLAEKIRMSYLRDNKIEVIYNGIDTKMFKPRNSDEVRNELNLPQDRYSLLLLAADLMDPRKGSIDFLKSLTRLDRDDFYVISVGNKTKRIKQLFPTLDIYQMGYISNRCKLAKIYNAADIYCISSYQDNFPTTVLESMASGTPVIGYRTGGIPEQIDPDCGFLVEQGNIEQFSKAIINMLDNDNLRNAYGNNCRKKALDEFSIKKFRNDHINLYLDLLQS